MFLDTAESLTSMEHASTKRNIKPMEYPEKMTLKLWKSVGLLDHISMERA